MTSRAVGKLLHNPQLRKAQQQRLFPRFLEENHRLAVGTIDVEVFHRAEILTTLARPLTRRNRRGVGLLDANGGALRRRR